MKTVRHRLFAVIEPAEKNDRLSRIFDISVMLLIIINVAAVIIESLNGKSSMTVAVLDKIEIVSVIIFTLEYAARIATADLKFPCGSRFKSVVKYGISFMAVVDLLAIIPFYLPMLIAVDLRFLRMLRLTRLLRVLKINRYTKSLKMISRVLKRKREDLIVTIFVMTILLLLSSSVMYYLECDAQPDVFPNIIAAFWWAIATLTTVGYGDVYPVTIWGKVISAIIAVLGIGIVALPTGIISSGFIEEVEAQKKLRSHRAIPERRRNALRTRRARGRSPRRPGGGAKRKGG